MLALLIIARAHGQNYPVQINAQLVAPFSCYLSDYANPGEEKLKLLVTFNDFTKPQYNIKLKISVQGQGISINSKSYYFAGPFTLEPGIPLEISGSDLYGLLSSQNLDFQGISQAQYEQKKVLPEGYYSVCVTAYDFNNPVPLQVSNAACAQAWMILSDPPFLNLPLCGSTLTVSNPQQLAFSFTQMNMGSPNSAASTEYAFELWEVRPHGAIANNIVQTTPPVYTFTTNFTVVNYGITEPPLLTGMEYAWRVRAYDISGRDYFKNNGYSQVCTFIYGNAYGQLNIDLNLHAQAVSQRQIKVWWDSLSNFSSYLLEFRKAGGDNWFPATTTQARMRILNLEPATQYEFRVQGISSEFTSPFSQIVSATTQPMPNYQCGELPSFAPGTFTPLQQAHAKMFWQVGQFEMQVVHLNNPVSPSGVYSGYGKIRMPFINDVYCEFKNISVSNEMVVVQGKVQALSKGIEQWQNENTIGTVQDGTSEAEVHTNTPLGTGDFNVNSSNGTVGVGGTTYTYTPNGLTVQDSNGALFIITSDGQVIHAGTQGNGQGPVPEYKNFITTDKGVVVFAAAAKQLYGIDKFKHAALSDYYLKVRNLTSGTHEPVDWKSVMAQKYDVIDLSYQLQGGLQADSILFVTGTGTIYKPQGSGNSRQLYIIGGKHGDAQELFACYRYNKDSLVNVAKINIVSYKQAQNKVTLVPLGSGITLDRTQMQKAVNDIFKQSVSAWEVDVAPAIAVGDTLWDKDGNGRINTGSNLFTRYSAELRALNKYIREQAYYTSDGYYLVVTDKPTDSLAAGLLGEMPRGRNIGYLFTSTPTATLVAHELAHGAFALEHSFDGNATLPKGSSPCLMDYNSGTELYKGKYWDYVHNPVTVVGVLEGDEEGASIAHCHGRERVFEMLQLIKSAYRNNELVKINKNTSMLCSVENINLAGVLFDHIRIRVIERHYDRTADPKKLSNGTSDYLYAGSGLTQHFPCVKIDEGIIIIEVPANRRELLTYYLKGLVDGKNLLLFVNGYRTLAPDPVEIPKPPDEISFGDINGYWEGLDAQFINRIGTRNVAYADGHHSVSTANHLSTAAFTANYAEWQCASTLGIALTSLISPVTGACALYYHNDKLFKLHTQPNNSGFQLRKANGMKAGADLLNKINSGEIKFDIASDTVDIVCHSMGYAYAQGIIEALKMAKFKLGRYYIIAPENPSAGSVNLKDFEEVWQYGSDDQNDPVWEQDGVAPQCKVGGIQNSNRRYFPTQEKIDFDKGYLNCHYIKNYRWIFTEVKPLENGYVKPRH